MTKPQIQELARVGAQARLQALEDERRSLLALFPELKDARRDGRSANGAAPVAKAAPARRRKRMSAAARKALSERMSAYWAARRAAKTERGDGAQPSGSSAGSARRGTARGRRKK
jgi:hypothetical protein